MDTGSDGEVSNCQYNPCHFYNPIAVPKGAGVPCADEPQ